MNQIELTAEQIDQIREEAYADPVFFCQWFFPEKFSKVVPWLHRGILAILTKKTDFLLKYGELDKIVSHFVWVSDPDDKDAVKHPIFHIVRDEAGVPVSINMDVTKFTQLMLPRGFSKTTLAGQAVPLYKILYQETKVLVYVSESGTHAAMQLTNVARELESNGRVLAVFGNIVPSRTERLKWTNDQIQTLTGITVLSRGRGGQIRGINVDGYRPDFIILDDVEDKESVSTDDQRKKAKTWLYGDVIPALPAMNLDAGIMVLGTLLHSDSMMMALTRDPDWTTIRFGAIDNDGIPIWADNMSLEQIEAKKLSYTIAGQITEFYMEYMSILRDDKTAKFKEENLIYFIPSKAEFIGVAIALDPAISPERRADFAAIGVVAMTSRGFMDILEIWMEKGVSPSTLLDKFFELSKYYDCTQHGIEAIAYQASLIHTCKEMMHAKQQYFEIQPITHSNKQKKDTRILGILQPRYNNKHIRHAKRFPLYEGQLLDFPNGKKDGPDVVAMAVNLLAPYSYGAIPDNQDPEKDEYPPLEEVMGGEWRAHV